MHFRKMGDHKREEPPFRLLSCRDVALAGIERKVRIKVQSSVIATGDWEDFSECECLGRSVDV